MRVLALLVTAVFMNTAICWGADKMIADGSVVKFDYTLTVEGQVVDTSDGKQPLEYTQGQGAIIPGLEKEMVGMKVGESKHVTVAPVDAYGAVNPAAFQEVPRTAFPPDINLQPGMVLPLKDNDGRALPALVSEVSGDKVVLNFNHPLAGKELTFDVKVVEIK